MTAYVPDRGDCIWLDFNPQAGHEQAGRRPAIVLSPRVYNQRSNLCILSPITSREKGYPFEVKLPPGGALNGVVLVDQIKSLDWRARNAEFIMKMPPHLTEEALRKLRTLL